MRKVTLSVVVVLAMTGLGEPALSQPTPSTELYKDTRKLMEITGSGNLARQIMNQMLEPMKRTLPNAPEEFWTRFMAKVDTDDLIDMTVPIYAKYLTHEEIKQLLEFYQSPVGRKVIAALPAIMQESMLAGQQWGEQLGRQVYEELKAEGYLQPDG